MISSSFFFKWTKPNTGRIRKSRREWKHQSKTTQSTTTADDFDNDNGIQINLAYRKVEKICRCNLAGPKTQQIGIWIKKLVYFLVTFFATGKKDNFQKENRQRKMEEKKTWNRRQGNIKIVTNKWLYFTIEQRVSEIVHVQCSHATKHKERHQRWVARWRRIGIRYSLHSQCMYRDFLCISFTFMNIFSTYIVLWLQTHFHLSNNKRMIFFFALIRFLSKSALNFIFRINFWFSMLHRWRIHRQNLWLNASVLPLSLSLSTRFKLSKFNSHFSISKNVFQPGRVAFGLNVLFPSLHLIISLDSMNNLLIWK